MSEFTFVFSKDACIKTCIYFAVMYIAVIIFNTLTISRYKLINLLTAVKKNEKVKLKNPIISILIFIASSVLLGYAYYLVTGGVYELRTGEQLLKSILMGVIGTVGVFWSLSGFILMPANCPCLAFDTLQKSCLRPPCILIHQLMSRRIPSSGYQYRRVHLVAYICSYWSNKHPPR